MLMLSIINIIANYLYVELTRKDVYKLQGMYHSLNF